MKMTNETADAIEILYRARQSRIVIGLTGRTGSGCTTAAKILKSKSDDLEFPTTDGAMTVTLRKDRIVRNFFRSNWQPCFPISVTPIIASFILEDTGAAFSEFLISKKIAVVGEAGLPQLVSAINGMRAANSATIDRVRNRSDWDERKKITDYIQTTLPTLVQTLKEFLGKNYTRTFQEIADKCRRFGGLYLTTPDVANVFSIVKRIDYFIGEIGKPDGVNHEKYFVVDALRNPFEAQWLKENIPGFFLVAINTPDSDRRSRLHETGLDRKTIAEFDEREYPKQRKKVPSGIDSWISQDIQGCIERADIHLANPGLPIPGQIPDLILFTKQIVRYTCLIIHPGLITPTREERSMQAAYVARVNSGCISRQVGAVITDRNGSVLAVGWNDVPFGQVPCLLRHRDDLLNKQDDAAFSDFEKKDEEFRKFYLKDLTISADSKERLHGRSAPFCFRDTYNSYKGEKNQVHTRSLHAEENAFLQLAKHGVQLSERSVLYSTASPCELCSKKAFQLGISEVVYVDPYPGISVEQILHSGAIERRPKVTLFSGAIGAAYHRLYEPLMTFKDELTSLCNSKTLEAPKALDGSKGRKGQKQLKGSLALDDDELPAGPEAQQEQESTPLHSVNKMVMDGEGNG